MSNEDEEFPGTLFVTRDEFGGVDEDETILLAHELPSECAVIGEVVTVAEYVLVAVRHVSTKLEVV